MIKNLSIADVITITNAVLGFIALLMMFYNHLQIAASLILLGLLTDGLDGIIARRMRKSGIGEYLEAIADMISLSIAPLVLVYKIYYDVVTFDIYIHLLLYVVIIFSLICSLIRLSSFSLFKEKEFFVGLPTSVSAIFLVLILFFKPNFWYITPVIVIFSLLMISSIRFPKPGLKVNFITAVLIIITVVFQSLYYNFASILLLIGLLLYVIFGPIYFVFFKRRAIRYE